MLKLALFGVNHADEAVLSGGNWRTALPLQRMQSLRLRDVARSVDRSLASTRFRVVFPQPCKLLGHFLGPTNATVDCRMRVRAYDSASSGDNPQDVGLIADSGWFYPMRITDPVEIADRDDPWRGIEPGDAERLPWLHYLHPEPVTVEEVKIDLDDRFNPAGYLDIGRLFQAGFLAPTLNAHPSANGFTFENATLSAETISGVVHHWRRLNPRVYEFGWPVLPRDEVLGRTLDFFRAVGFDREVFVVPKVGGRFFQSRSFLGHVQRLNPIAQAASPYAAFGAAIKEKVG